MPDQHNFDLQGRVALVTGASRGIGAATARRLAAAGAAGVVIHYHRQLAAAREVALQVEAYGARTLIFGADIASHSEVSSLFEAITGEFGQLDILVANAGIWPPLACTLSELDDSRWAETMRTNLDGMYYLCRGAIRLMLPRRSGSIITISSTAGQRGEAGHADYAASKGAVISLTKSLATELGPAGIRVNCVAPGWVDTEMVASALHTNPERLAEITRAIPLRRVATADDIAGPVLFLASDLSRHVTGEILNVNGGSVLCG